MRIFSNPISWMKKLAVNAGVLVVVAVPMSAHAASAVKANAELDYAIKLLPAATGSEWQVTLKLKGNADGTTEFDLPSKWAGRENLQQGIKDFKASADGVVVEAPEEDGASDQPGKLRRIKHAPGAALTIEYRLTRIGNDYPDSQRDAYSPVLQSNYFHVIGIGAWVVPRGDHTHPVKIALRWDLPDDWSIANSFGANQRVQTFSASLDAFRHALYVGGDFRIAKLIVRNQPVYVAIRGEWGFFDENFTGLAQRVVDMERGFWPDYHYPYFLISMIPVGRPVDGVNIGGTALENAFALFLSPRTQVKDLRYLLVHELWHNWNAQKLGRLKEPEQLLYWWSEGITDFYTNRLLLRSGLYTPQEYLKTYNGVLKAYTQSKARNAPNSRVEAEFWKNAEVGKLPYQRGMLFAVRLDRDIRQASNGKVSLDDVMRDLLASAKAKDAKKLDSAVLNAHFERRLGRSYAAEINRYLEQGETIELASGDLGGCFERQDTPFRSYEPGFNIDASIAAKKAVGVVPESAAYQAGLREGMPVVGWSIHHGDPTREIELTAIVDDQRKSIKFLPVGKEIIAPQFVLKAGLTAADLKRCDR